MADNTTPHAFRILSPSETERAEQENNRMRQQWFDSTCGCQDPDDQYLFNIDCGEVELRHAACGKPPRWMDWQDISFSDTVLATVTIEHCCDCNPYVQLGHDCGSEINITFPKEQS